MDRTAEPSIWTQKYDPAAAAAYYRERELLTAEQFGKLFLDTMEIRRLGIDGLDWLLFDHILSVYREIPIIDHYKAAARAVGSRFEGIEPLYRYLIELELLPPWTLNKTILYRAPNGGARIGDLMVESGLMDIASVERSLAAQRTILEKTGVSAAVGQIFRTVGTVSVVDIYQLLALQAGIPFECLDDSVPAIYEAVMSRK